MAVPLRPIGSQVRDGTPAAAAHLPGGCQGTLHSQAETQLLGLQSGCRGSFLSPDLGHAFPLGSLFLQPPFQALPAILLGQPADTWH